jgi:hypothetical protein
MFGAEAHVGIGGEMNHQFRAFDRLRQAGPVEQVCLMKTKFRVPQSSFEKLAMSGRHIIEPNDAMARGEQAVDHVTGNKARRAGDENAQSNLRAESGPESFPTLT